MDDQIEPPVEAPVFTPAELAMIAEAEADAEAGLVIPASAVFAWLDERRRIRAETAPAQG